MLPICELPAAAGGGVGPEGAGAVSGAPCRRGGLAGGATGVGLISFVERRGECLRPLGLPVKGGARVDGPSVSFGPRFRVRTGAACSACLRVPNG